MDKTLSFQDLKLRKELINALSDLEFDEATPIQHQCFSHIAAGKDLVGVAQTGTGKTMAYVLPILQNLKFSKQRHARVLVLVPTRELVLQVEKEIQKAAKYISVRTVAVYGGRNIQRDKDAVFAGSDIIVATPGRIYDLIMAGVMRTKELKILVIDEVDEMLSLGFRPQITSILETVPAKIQSLMFSATLSEEIDDFVVRFFKNAEKVEIAPSGTPLEQITQRAVYAHNFNTKINFLNVELKKDEYEKVLLFAPTKKYADLISDALEKNFKNQIAVIHSNKSQNQRLAAIRKFSDGEVRILIATDVVARGIDIDDISHVIQFNIPEIPGDFIHRSGRTGRATKEGINILLIGENEVEFFEIIEGYIKRIIDIEELSKDIQVSKTLLEDEKPTPAYDIDYLKGYKPNKKKKR